MTDAHTTGLNDSTLAAAEYVLGVWSAQERRDFELRLPQDPALAREVEVWEERLGGLASEVRPVVPPPGVWGRIEAIVAAHGDSASRRPSLWQSLAFWRWAAMASATVAAASILGLIYLTRATVPDQPLIARLDVGADRPVSLPPSIPRATASLSCRRRSPT
jgi:anti-sigma-K factor RskA